MKSDIWLICSGHKGSQGGKRRTRLTVGGDQIEYPGDKSTRTAGLTTEKILINSVISTLEGPNSLSLTSRVLLKHPPWAIRIYGNQFVFAASRNDR
jgi:hypothetical protein